MMGQEDVRAATALRRSHCKDHFPTSRPHSPTPHMDTRSMRQMGVEHDGRASAIVRCVLHAHSARSSRAQCAWCPDQRRRSSFGRLEGCLQDLAGGIWGSSEYVLLGCSWRRLTFQTRGC